MNSQQTYHIVVTKEQLTNSMMKKKNTRQQQHCQWEKNMTSYFLHHRKLTCYSKMLVIPEKTRRGKLIFKGHYKIFKRKSCKIHFRIHFRIHFKNRFRINVYHRKQFWSEIMTALFDHPTSNYWTKSLSNNFHFLVKIWQN